MKNEKSYFLILAILWISAKSFGQGFYDDIYYCRDEKKQQMNNIVIKEKPDVKEYEGEIFYNDYDTTYQEDYYDVEVDSVGDNSGAFLNMKIDVTSTNYEYRQYKYISCVHNSKFMIHAVGCYACVVPICNEPNKKKVCEKHKIDSCNYS